MASINGGGGGWGYSPVVKSPQGRIYTLIQANIPGERPLSCLVEEIFDRCFSDKNPEEYDIKFSWKEREFDSDTHFNSVEVNGERLPVGPWVRDPLVVRLVEKGLPPEGSFSNK